MESTFRIGRIFGIDIRAKSGALILLLIVMYLAINALYPEMLPGLSRNMYIFLGLLTTVLLYISLLTHELAHAIVARKNGIEIVGVVLMFVGAAAIIKEELKTPQAEFKMATAGPLASIFMAFVFMAIAIFIPDTLLLPKEMFVYLTVINLVLAAFNLLPGFPLDGGRILRSIFWLYTDNIDKSTRMAVRVSLFIALGLGIFGLIIAFNGNFFSGLWFVFLSNMLFGMSKQTSEMLEIKEQTKK
ncbi:TPA: hypothetical protein DDW69_00145 [candidate division CPR2 bacterium]|uniref:Peptidase M50 n=1 Tax=candidate division CPR2 bacterium GW2011_GWC1_41_48 TaxID=1618344 RepID=A0A0G0W9J4_UNCC2|nr:MAG: Peptidase M50 [candidate division CPR2 bacterium GW2011_GWC2_39_35]KKR28478.1 MAG: Peptidase M50 [candidate division CPR2 bacterium GW2011_GWD2_39_7]KKR29456.1 MAG: Peptidase M50 [candidate division CPR2 bacterium GW2011_GWD1_39_7]KKS08727.1 MAG: Peptidase M50 [candidate division CPR2 bacterium GW2011_GWC1_41_48]OGB55615.1 MAG: hypothetical protein A2Y27_03205 [candidate division CPR2 bacterium GWD1_39_7]OGB72744.1 MAG: hypothetical protein A2Y26_04705 [candidate division CPR2 bacteriu